MKRNKYKLIAAAFIAVILAFAFMWDTGIPSQRDTNLQPPQEISSALTQFPSALSSGIPTDDISKDTVQDSIENIKTVEDTSPAQSSDASNALPTAPPPATMQDDAALDNELTCTLSVRCDTILNNLEKLDTAKTSLIPKDGIIFAEKTVKFYDGESVFDILVREMKQNKIQLEFENTPVYNSAYIEGIANIYEFDCGGISGWKYKVNGVFADCGCSQYMLNPGDRVEWVYTIK